ncbi:hypothetical protein D3C72_2291330 [compost metagenome]
MGASIGAPQLQGLARIVGHGERLGAEGGQVYGFHIACHTQPAPKVGRPHSRIGASTHPHRNAIAHRQRLRTANVIGMLVRDENGVEVFGQ